MWRSCFPQKVFDDIVCYSGDMKKLFDCIDSLHRHGALTLDNFNIIRTVEFPDKAVEDIAKDCYCSGRGAYGRVGLFAAAPKSYRPNMTQMFKQRMPEMKH